MADKVQGVSVKDKDGFDFHTTKYENSGNSGDKGTRTSSDYVAKNGGWSRDDSTKHNTNQNVPKGKPGRH